MVSEFSGVSRISAGWGPTSKVGVKNYFYKTIFYCLICVQMSKTYCKQRAVTYFL